ncbi:MAG: GFA family protein [Terricaulis sp.]|nr:GFA family protein [Terricaulis sp.]
MTTHQGSCHCGAVKISYAAEIDGAMSCNCSHCRRKGYLLAFGPVEALSVEAEDGALSVYRFNKHVIDHHFCARCGCATHGVGVGPGGVKMAAVNVRCIPAIDLDALTITKVDGASY